MRPRALSATLAIAVGLLLAARPAAAANCTVSTTPVSFGAYNVFSGAPLDSTGMVTCWCDDDRDIEVRFNQGSSTTFQPRTMRKGPEVLNYNLYLNAARTTIWGDGSGGTSVYSGSISSGSTVDLIVYGRVPALQNVSAGAYSDTVTVTFEF